MARHRSPRGRGTYPAPPRAAPSRHGQGSGTRPDPALPAAAPVQGSVAVLDRPDSQVWREPLTRVAPQPPRPAEPRLLELPERTPGTVRRGTVAVAVAGGALSLVAAAIPADAFAGGTSNAFTLFPTSETTTSDDRQAEPSDEAGDGRDAAPLADTAPARRQPLSDTPGVADVSDLVSGVQQAQAQVNDQVAAAQQKVAEATKAAEEKKAAAAKAAAEKASLRDCGLNETGLGAVKPFVRTAAELIGCRFGKPTVYGVAGRGGVSDHPGGKAVDFMVDRATGDALAACALRNQDALGITYVIWRQRINMGGGWQAMEDRGGITANHFDHVHVSFGNGAQATSLQGC